MSILVQCNRCLVTEEAAEFTEGSYHRVYGIPPSSWLTLDNETHLCPACKKRALGCTTCEDEDYIDSVRR